MTHPWGCENAKKPACVCPCGGTGHQADLIGWVATNHEEAKNWAAERLKASLGQSGTPIGTKPRESAEAGVNAVIAQLVLAALTKGPLRNLERVVQELANGISTDLIDDMTEVLAARERSRRPKNHFWCVALVGVCETYDEWCEVIQGSINETAAPVIEKAARQATRIVMKKIKPKPVHTKSNVTARAIGLAPYKKRCSFVMDKVLERLLQRALCRAFRAICKAAKASTLDHVMVYVRLFCALLCPDPAAHPAVINYCLWPLIKEHFKEDVEAQLQEWLTDKYPYHT